MSEILELISRAQQCARDAATEPSDLALAHLTACPGASGMRPHVLVTGIDGTRYPRQGEYGDRIYVKHQTVFNSLFAFGDPGEDPATLLRDVIAFLEGAAQ